MANGKFLTSDLLADIGLERLRLPVPMAKLQIIYGVARALDDKTTKASTWGALLRWIAALELESEVLEALCILFVAKESSTLSLEELRRAITRPSILSDYFVAMAFSTPALVRTWEKCHSGEVPSLYGLSEIERELSESHIVPPILSSTLRDLQKRTGLPFMRQWAYEFDRLQSTYGSRSQGYLEFFDGQRGRNGVGQFISSRGHMARSAYLRVFDLAVDLWDMPEDEALHFARYATPADFSFLRMLPGSPPPWAPTALNLAGDSYGECADVVREFLSRCEGATEGFLAHYDGPLYRSARLQADLEIITFNYRGGTEVSQDALFMHDWLPGHVFIPRDDDDNFHLPPWPDDHTFPTKMGTVVQPCLVPTVLGHVGYLHTDLIQRIPYLPISHTAVHSLVTYSRAGGADITCEDEAIGRLHYWNYQWQPMHYKELGSHCSVAVTMNSDMARTLFSCANSTTTRCWRVKVYSRENDHGEWKETIHRGILE